VRKAEEERMTIPVLQGNGSEILWFSEIGTDNGRRAAKVKIPLLQCVYQSVGDANCPAVQEEWV
jgi:hypothetical protein